MDLILPDLTLLIPFIAHLVIFILLRRKRRFMSEAFILSLLVYEGFFIFVLWESLPAFMALMFLLIGVPMLALIAHLLFLGVTALIYSLNKTR